MTALRAVCGGPPPSCGEASGVGIEAGDARGLAHPREAGFRSPVRRRPCGFAPPLTPPRQGEGNCVRPTVAAAITLLAATLCSSASVACTVPEGFARLATPEAEVAYRWEPGKLEVGRFFAAEVIACRAPGPGAVEGIVLDLQMPAHGHGMNYRPTVEQTGPGRFRFTGLMLHMAGTWRLTFDLLQGEKRTRLSQDVNLKP